MLFSLAYQAYPPILVQYLTDKRRKMIPRTQPHFAPYSRATALAKLDGRTREARLMGAVRDELIAHVGNRPSATQAAMIQQAVQLRLRLATMDRKFAETGAMTEHDSRTYLAWANSYTRLLKQLGMKGAPERAPSLADIMRPAP